MTLNNQLNKDVEDNKVVAAISYVWILCLIPLFFKRNSRFAQFHAKQGLILFILEVIGSIIFVIPLVGWVLFVMVIAFAIIGLLKALQGEYWEMPIFGKYARKINL